MTAGRTRIEIDIARVAELAGRGLSQAEICLIIGVSEDTLQRRKAESAEFAAAVKRGKAVAAETVSNKLFELAQKGDLGAIIWYEKTRCNRTDKVAHELTGKDGGPIEVTAVAKQQAAKQLTDWRQEQMSALSNGSALLVMPDTSLTTSE